MYFHQESFNQNAKFITFGLGKYRTTSYILYLQGLRLRFRRATWTKELQLEYKRSFKEKNLSNFSQKNTDAQNAAVSHAQAKFIQFVFRKNLCYPFLYPIDSCLIFSPQTIRTNISFSWWLLSKYFWENLYVFQFIFSFNQIEKKT